jgi:DMSO/TMAO reductase YedYZ heme-binding membrane subunit
MKVWYRHWRRSSPTRDTVQRIMISLGVVAVLLFVILILIASGGRGARLH